MEALKCIEKNELRHLVCKCSVTQELYGYTTFIPDRDKILQILAVHRAPHLLADAEQIVLERLERLAAR